MHGLTFRRLLAASLPALLAACGSAPTGKPPLAPVTAGVPAPSPRYAITAPPTSPAPGEAGIPPAQDGLPGDLQPPQLLGGELPREFQRGQASWYGPRFNGRRTASGERFDMNEFTAAHRTLPFGTLVRVHSLVNGRDVDVRITDRGPYSGNRIIDVSRAAAEELGMLGLGLKEVVLLVPDSTPQVTTLPAPAARKRPPARRRPAPPRLSR